MQRWLPGAMEVSPSWEFRPGPNGLLSFCGREELYFLFQGSPQKEFYSRAPGAIPRITLPCIRISA